MMETTLTKLISLNDIAARVPGRPSIACLWRWCRRGVKARNGSIVRLRHSRAGRRLFTTEEWLGQFFSNVADTDLDIRPAGTTQTLRPTYTHDQAVGRINNLRGFSTPGEGGPNQANANNRQGLKDPPLRPTDDVAPKVGP